MFFHWVSAKLVFLSEIPSICQVNPSIANKKHTFSSKMTWQLKAFTVKLSGLSLQDYMMKGTDY